MADLSEEIAQWRANEEVKTLLANEALRLSADMKAARREELEIAEKGDPAKQTIFFRLPSESNARIPALRSVVATRIFNQMLLGCKEPFEIDVTSSSEVEKGEEEKEAETKRKESKEADIVLEGVSKITLELTLEFIYSADSAVGDDNVHDILAVANELKLPVARALCTMFLKQPSKCTAETVCTILESAHKSEAPELKQHCLKFIEEHTMAVLSLPSFQPPPHLFAEILSLDGLTIDELELFRRVYAWAQREQAARREGGGKVSLSECLCGEGVIERVRFPLISPEQLRDTVQPMLLRDKDVGAGENGENGANGEQEEKGSGDGSKYMIPEQLLLEAYQHHALASIGQQSQVGAARTRERGLKRREMREEKDRGNSSSSSSSSSGIANWKRRVDAARERARRTDAWIGRLPPGVERVSMSGMGLGDDDIVLLSEWLRARGKGLVELDLKCNHISYESLLLLLEGCKSCPRLRGLAMGQNPLARGGGEGGMLGKRLGEAMREGGGLSRLEKLGLGATEVTDEDARELAAAVGRKHVTLQVLGLSGNLIRGGGAQALVASQEGRVGPLHTLVLSQNRVDPSDFPSLRSIAHPGLNLKL